jgi:hypothetical protein
LRVRKSLGGVSRGGETLLQGGCASACEGLGDDGEGDVKVHNYDAEDEDGEGEGGGETGQDSKRYRYEEQRGDEKGIDRIE